MAEMRRTTIRMPDHFYELVEREADESGLSVAGLVREAVLARIIWGRAIRGESIYAVAHQSVVAARGSNDAPATASDEIAQAVQAIAEHAPEHLDAMLRVLDERAPARAQWLREVYLIPPGGFIADQSRPDRRLDPSLERRKAPRH